MTFKILFVVVVTMALCIMAETGDEAQTKSRVSDDQIDFALHDQRYLKRQIKCALGEAPCDPVGRRLKNLAPYILRGSCPHCTTEEIRQTKKVLAYIQRTFPKEWAKVVKKYTST